MDLTFYNEFYNRVFNLEIGWSNWYWCDENIKYLLSQKEIAFKCKKELKKNGFDVEDIYKQIENFEEKVKFQKTFTGERREAIILTAMEYAQYGKPIIYSKANNLHKKSIFDAEEDREKSTYRYQYDVLRDLIGFYYDKKNELKDQLQPLIYQFLDAYKFLIKKYPDGNWLHGEYWAITYLKFLVKDKNYDEATSFFYLYEDILKPQNEKEEIQLEKLKSKFLIKKIKG